MYGKQEHERDESNDSTKEVYEHTSFENQPALQPDQVTEGPPNTTEHAESDQPVPADPPSPGLAEEEEEPVTEEIEIDLEKEDISTPVRIVRVANRRILRWAAIIHLVAAVIALIAALIEVGTVALPRTRMESPNTPAGPAAGTEPDIWRDVGPTQFAGQRPHRRVLGNIEAVYDGVK